MKHFELSYLAVVPLFSLLCMPPTMLEKKIGHARSIASIKEEIRGRPRYEKLVEKIRPEDTIAELSSEEHMDKLGGLKLRLLQEREQFSKNISAQALVTEQRNSLEALVAETVLIEGSLKSLQEKKEIQDQDANTRTEVLSASKDIIESLLIDLEANEVLVAKEQEAKIEERPVIAEQPVVVIEKPNEDSKKEEPKKDDKLCESDEKNKILTKQVEELMKQQNQILQAMVSMTQMMVSMHQQQQQNPFYQNGPGWNQSPYQYHQPVTAGNWVYYPSGSQPQQVNIFQQPSINQFQMPQISGIFPDQIYGQQQPPQQQPLPQYQQPVNTPFPQQSHWAIQPDPRFNVQMYPMPPGNFGQPLNGLGFNMGQIPVTSFIP